MTEDDVGAAEAREASRLAAMKARVGSDVNAEISGHAAKSSTGADARVAEVAGRMRDTALDDTVRRDRTVSHARTAARGSQFLDYAFYVLYALLGLRLVLGLIAARSGNGFVRFIAAITDPFYAPFKGIVASPATEGGNTLVLPIVIALAVYAMVHVGINGLLRMVGSRKTSI